jgi:hypothetical protein
VLNASPNQLSSTLSVILTELPEFACLVMLELDKTGSSFAPAHLLSDGIGEILQFGDDGAGVC